MVDSVNLVLQHGKNKIKSFFVGGVGEWLRPKRVSF